MPINSMRAGVFRARAKSATPRTIPVSLEVIRLYADYLHEEYGDLDSDYVFVNLWSQPFGRPWGYPAVYDLVLRLRRATGVDFDPHWYRHMVATRLEVSIVASGASFDKIRKLLLPATSLFRLDQGRLAIPRHTHPDQAIDPAVALNVTMLQPILWHPASDSCISCN